MKDVAHVTGKDWLGSLPELGPAIYIGAEDDENEIHIRLLDIAKHYGVTFKELIERGLHVLCLLGKDATLCATGKSGRVEDNRPLPAALRSRRRHQTEKYQHRHSVPRLRRQRDRPRAGLRLRHAHAGAGNGGRRLGHGLKPSKPSRHRLRLRHLAARPPGTVPSGSGNTSKAPKPIAASSRTATCANSSSKKSIRPDRRNHRAAVSARPVPARSAACRASISLPREQKADELFLMLLAQFERQGRNVSDKANSPTATRRAAFRKESGNDRGLTQR